MAEIRPDANALYAGACQETAARIQARETVLIAFITISSAIIGVSLKEDYRFASVVVGYTALATALLVRHHDLIIGLLGRYQYDLCESARKDGCASAPSAALPRSWFSEEYFPEVFGVRRMRDRAQELFILIGIISALILAFPPNLKTYELIFLGCRFSSRYAQWAVWSGSLLSSACAFVVTEQSFCKRKIIAGQMLNRMSQVHQGKIPK